jgi:hypothetical protein
VHTQNPVSLLRKELDKAFGVKVRLGPRVSGEGELSTLVLDTSGLQVLFCLTNSGDLGMVVDNRGNNTVVDVTVACFDILNSSSTFLFGLVSKHRTEGDVTNALDVLH